MIKKIGSVVLGVSVIGIVALGYNNSFTSQASHADFPAPARSAYINIAYGDYPAPAYSHADLPAPQKS